MSMAPHHPLIVIVDDDTNVRDSLRGLMRSLGYEAEAFGSVEALRAAALPVRIDCLLLDIRLPGQDGLDYYEELVRAGGAPPAVFISGHASAEIKERACRAGAIACFLKPARGQDLIDAIAKAIAGGGVRPGEAASGAAPP
ncbi:response regulator transcription factor [Salinarimonas soli]|uniref:Response regulator n=1 Tax=Salinarimonas soli TaxID=1638099 RepID=A0A5B2VC55_9HYPH|nr:response regulator [Salinarimonas soli]KAA2236564.1 response regulator [Salinarimonas soli]